MPLDEIAGRVISRLGVVRIKSNALNTLLYISLVIVPVSWGCAWLFHEDPILRYGFAGFGAFYALAFLAHYTRFAIKAPDRLQSEEHLARMQELAIIERKGRRGPTIIQPAPNDRSILEQDLLQDDQSEENR